MMLMEDVVDLSSQYPKAGGLGSSASSVPLVSREASTVVVTPSRDVRDMPLGRPQICVAAAAIQYISVLKHFKIKSI